MVTLGLGFLRIVSAFLLRPQFRIARLANAVTYCVCPIPAIPLRQLIQVPHNRPCKHEIDPRFAHVHILSANMCAFMRLRCAFSAH